MGFTATGVNKILDTLLASGNLLRLGEYSGGTLSKACPDYEIGSTDFNAAANGSKSNKKTIRFPERTSSGSATVSHVGVLNGSTLWYYAALSSSTDLNNAELCKFKVGDFSITVDDSGT